MALADSIQDWLTAKESLRALEVGYQSVLGHIYSGKSSLSTREMASLGYKDQYGRAIYRVLAGEFERRRRLLGS